MRAALNKNILKKVRPLGLFLVRESDEWDMEMFNAMREQTYLPHRDKPAVEAVRRAGLAPMHGSDFVVTDPVTGRQHRVAVEPIERGGTKAYLFYYAGYWHLWSMASAASLNGNGVNEFTSILIEAFRRLRPKEVFAANFSRLIRKQSQGARVLAVVDGNVDVIWAGELPFPMSGKQAETGKMMFSMFAMVASMERDWIVQRLLAGRIAKWRRQEWPFGQGVVPFGYKVDPDTKRLVPDESKRKQVRQMLMILCSDAPPMEMARQLARLGLKTSRKHPRLKRKVSLAVINATTRKLGAFYSWAPLWLEGEFLVRWTNAFPEMDELAGLAVARLEDADGDIGEFQMLYKPGVPIDGWAEPELLALFRQKARSRMAAFEAGGASPLRPLNADVVEASANPDLHSWILPSGYIHRSDIAGKQRHQRSRAKRVLAPLLGRIWSNESGVYELQYAKPNLYKVVRFPHQEPPADGVIPGTEVVGTGDRS